MLSTPNARSGRCPIGSRARQPDAGEVEVHAEAHRPGDQPEPSEEVERSPRVAGQEQHGQEVQEAAPEAGRSELRSAVPARTMVDGHLGDPEAAPGGERRDEAMELPVEPELLDHLAPVDLEARVEVVEPDAGQEAGDPVEQPGRPGLGPRVLTLLLPARYQVEAVLEAGEELRHLGGIVLEVGVQGDDDVSLRLAEAHGQGGGLAEVASELQAADPGSSSRSFSTRSKDPSRLPSSTKRISYGRPSCWRTSVSSRWRTPRLSTSSRTGRTTETSI